MSNETGEAKQKTFRSGLFGMATQPGPPGPQAPPLAPAGDPVLEMPWLSTAFPHAAVREEQIRQAAEAMKARAEPPDTGDARREQQADGAATGPSRIAEEGIAFEGRPAQEKPEAFANRPRSAGSFPDAIPTQAATAPAPSNVQREPLAQKPAFLSLAVSQAAPGILDDETAEWWTLDVFAPLIHAADAEDWEGLEAILAMQFAFVASATPKDAAVENHKNMLLTLGPPDRTFRSTITRTADLFLSERPRLVAAEVERALQNGEPAAATALCAWTDHETADPLTAGRIFARCDRSVAAIAALLRRAGVYEDAEAGASAASASAESHAPTRHEQLYQVFSDISAAADSASRSEEGLRAMKRLAADLRDAFIDMFVTASISGGDGVMLPLEIAHLRLQYQDYRGADALAFLIEVGVEELRHKMRAAVAALEDTASLLTEGTAQVDATGGGTPQTWRVAHPALADDLDGQLVALNRYSYAFMRAVRSLDEVGPWLDRLGNHEALRKLALPQQEDFSAVSFALRTFPASVAEALRQGDADPADMGADGQAHLRLRDAVLAMRWFEDFRQFLGADGAPKP